VKRLGSIFEFQYDTNRLHVDENVVTMECHSRPRGRAIDERQQFSFDEYLDGMADFVDSVKVLFDGRGLAGVFGLIEGEPHFAEVCGDSAGMEAGSQEAAHGLAVVAEDDAGQPVRTVRREEPPVFFQLPSDETEDARNAVDDGRGGPFGTDEIRELGQQRPDDFVRNGHDREVLHRVHLRFHEQVKHEAERIRDGEPDDGDHDLEAVRSSRLRFAEAEEFVHGVEPAFEGSRESAEGPNEPRDDAGDQVHPHCSPGVRERFVEHVFKLPAARSDGHDERDDERDGRGLDRLGKARGEQRGEERDEQSRENRRPKIAIHRFKHANLADRSNGAAGPDPSRSAHDDPMNCLAELLEAEPNLHSECRPVQQREEEESEHADGNERLRRQCNAVVVVRHRGRGILGSADDAVDQGLFVGFLLRQLPAGKAVNFRRFMAQELGKLDGEERPQEREEEVEREEPPDPRAEPRRGSAVDEPQINLGASVNPVECFREPAVELEQAVARPPLARRKVGELLLIPSDRIAQVAEPQEPAAREAIEQLGDDFLAGDFLDAVRRTKAHFVERPANRRCEFATELFLGHLEFILKERFDPLAVGRSERNPDEVFASPLQMAKQDDAAGVRERSPHRTPTERGRPFDRIDDADFPFEIDGDFLKLVKESRRPGPRSAREVRNQRLQCPIPGRGRFRAPSEHGFHAFE